MTTVRDLLGGSGGMTPQNFTERPCPLRGFEPCMGPMCTAWRWENDRVKRQRQHPPDMWSTVEPARPAGISADWEWHPAEPDEDQTAYWLESDEHAMAHREAHCGISGPLFPGVCNWQPDL